MPRINRKEVVLDISPQDVAEFRARQAEQQKNDDIMRPRRVVSTGLLTLASAALIPASSVFEVAAIAGVLGFIVSTREFGKSEIRKGTTRTSLR